MIAHYWDNLVPIAENRALRQKGLHLSLHDRFDVSLVFILYCEIVMVLHIILCLVCLINQRSAYNRFYFSYNLIVSLLRRGGQNQPQVHIGIPPGSSCWKILFNFGLLSLLQLRTIPRRWRTPRWSPRAQQWWRRPLRRLLFFMGKVCTITTIFVVIVTTLIVNYAYNDDLIFDPTSPHCLRV